MKHFQFLLCAVIAISAAVSIPAASADEFTDTIAMFKQSPVVQPFFDNAYGFAVFPTVGKGGVIVGGAYGQGQVYRQGEVTGTARMVKGSIGFQAGGQAFKQIVFLQDQRAYEEFTSGNFEFDAGVSAVAITAGAQAKAGTEGATAGVSAGPNTGAQAPVAYRKGIAVFVHAIGGFMLEAAVGGQKYSFEPRK